MLFYYYSPLTRPAPKDEDEMMVAIFECIDRLFGIVRPRKVIIVFSIKNHRRKYFILKNSNEQFVKIKLT